MAITPDTKDWTWVIERPCPECGFDANTFAPADVGELIRANAARWPALLGRADVATRPSPDRWSALEYGCHVRDVFRLYDYRLGLMLEQDDPAYPNWDQDVTAVEERYGEQDPAVVVHGLDAAAHELADHFDAVHGDQWQRTGTRSDGARFTVETFARYLVHDPVHHVYDVESGYVQIVRTQRR
jgi:hypothetical protein